MKDSRVVLLWIFLYLCWARLIGTAIKPLSSAPLRNVFTCKYDSEDNNFLSFCQQFLVTQLNLKQLIENQFPPFIIVLIIRPC